MAHKGDEPSMNLSQFYALVGPCSNEIDRLRRHYESYYKWHRQVFTDLLERKYATDEEFWQAADNARLEASQASETSAPQVTELTRQTKAAFARTNRRKLIKMAARILFLRLTEDKGEKPADAHRQIAVTLEPWGVGYHAVRKNVKFQIDG